MPGSQARPVAVADSPSGELEVKLASIPIEWSTVGFECSIIGIPAQGEAAGVSGLVRLRVNDAAPGSCRIEMYCGEAGLCRVSAGC